MKQAFIFAIAMFIADLGAQESLIYQKPSREILELVDVSPPPTVLLDNKKDYMVLLYRDAFSTIAELSKKEMRLGGLRIDPATQIGSRMNYYNQIKIKNISQTNGGIKAVTGLPENPRIANLSWSPDQKKIAFTQTTTEGVEVWVLDILTAAANKLTKPTANANLGDIINWFEDSQSLLVKMVSSDRKPLVDAGNTIPAGPTISEADGRKAQNRTYQDLLQNKNNEYNFEQLALSEIHRVTLDGTQVKWLGSAMYENISFSPNGEYVMIKTIEKPFSYLVPYYRFPSVTIIYTKDARMVKSVMEVPLIEDLPPGFMATRTGRRSMSWRSDKPATLVFVEALDGGNPENEVAYRDEIFQLEAPFSGTPLSLMKTVNRYSSILWGDDQRAIVIDRWWNTRNTKTYLFNPSGNGQKVVMLYDRNYQDRYSDPGRFVTEQNKWGNYVLSLKGSKAFLIGSGYSEEGQFPFLDLLDLTNGETERIYQSPYNDKLENLSQYDASKERLLVRIESPSEYPNYFFRDLKKGKLEQITDFKNPFNNLQGVHKEVITYKRDDGLELSGTLYLPLGYDMEKKEKAPMILWAYPREYKNKTSAGQTTANPNRFTFPYYGSPVFWVAKGYVVLDGASFPVVGEGNEEPNDSFREQLVANAKAAINAVDGLGYIDPEKVAVGGHSYGAFMVANLLSHSNLFAAGIARSGAYNRTLTPFGFQSEERNYWEAPDVYYNMSPFMHADKMKTPLLLIHGEADNNSGTYPIQSMRYFNALKGLGATVRLVMLPKESHGYRARESILHILWEQDQWLETYLKGAEMNPGQL